MGGVLVKRRIIPLLLIRLLNEFITKPVNLPFLLSLFTFQVFRASYETLDMGSTLPSAHSLPHPNSTARTTFYFIPNVHRPLLHGDGTLAPISTHDQ